MDKSKGRVFESRIIRLPKEASYGAERSPVKRRAEFAEFNKDEGIARDTVSYDDKVSLIFRP